MNAEFMNGVEYVVELCRDNQYLKSHYGKVFGIIHWPEVFQGILTQVVNGPDNHSGDFCEGVIAITEALNDAVFMIREYGAGAFGLPDYSGVLNAISGKTILKDYMAWTGKDSLSA